MSDFYVGQEVVCVDDAPHREWPQNKGTSDPTGLSQGAHYLVRWVGQYQMVRGGAPRGPSFSGVRLEGIDRTDGGKWADTPYQAARFRPIKSETIQIFREMCRAMTLRHRTPEDIQNEFEGKAGKHE